MRNITSWSCLLFVFVSSMVKGDSENKTSVSFPDDGDKGAVVSKAPADSGDVSHRYAHSTSSLLNRGDGNDTIARNRNHLGKRGAFGSAYGSLNTGYNNGYSLGSGYSSGLLLPTGSGMGSRYSSGLGYQTSGYGPVLGIGSGLGIASGLNSINAIGMAPVGLAPSTVITSGPGLGYSGGMLSAPTLSYSSSGYHTPSYSSGDYSASHYPYTKSYDTKPLIITKEVPIHIPQPYPVTVTKDVPYPVPQPYAVPVPKPYPVHVPQPVAVPVDKPYPVKVDRPVLYPYPQPVPYPVTKHIPYPVVKTLHVPSMKTVVVPYKSDYQHAGYGQNSGGLYAQSNYNTDNTHSSYGNGPYTYNLGVQG